MPFEKRSPARSFMTPPPTWKSRQSHPYAMPLSERKRSSPASKGDLFHIIHKVPAGDSPYVKAKQVQLVDKDPGRAISMFWAAINAGDRVESALKDMALIMKQLNRSDEAIEAIRSFRHLCPSDSQESLDNILVELYKRSGRIDEEIAMLEHKLKQIEEGAAFIGRRTKQARSQGKKIQITVEQEISRILGNLAWAYLQKGDYKAAEEHYRKALSFGADKNKQCNLAICLMQMNRTTEARFLLQAVSASIKNRKMDDSFAKSFERASEMLIEIESLESNRTNSISPAQAVPSPSTSWSSECNQGSRLVDKECTISCGQKSIDNENSSQSTPQATSVDEWKNGSCSRSLYGKSSCLIQSKSVTSEVEVTSYARKGFLESPNPARSDLRVPYTEPKRCLWGFNNEYHRREGWGDGNSDHKFSVSSPYNGKWRMLEDPDIKAMNKDVAVMGFDTRVTMNMKFPDKVKSATDESSRRPQVSESCQVVFGCAVSESCQVVSSGAVDFATSVDTEKSQSSGAPISYSAVEQSSNNSKSHGYTTGKPIVKKSWADMAEEEEEQELFSQIYTNFDSQDDVEEFNDENANSNIVHYQTEYLSQKLERIDLKDVYNESGNAALSRNPTARRSLCFNRQLTPESTDIFSASSSKKASTSMQSLKMAAKERDSMAGEKKLTRRNRLQVFQDITHQFSP